jgi:hypothetical protein
MTERVDISQDLDVSMLDSSDPVIVIADFEVEVIQELDQGPPGPPSTVPGPMGPPGPQGGQGNPGLPGNQIYYGTTNPTPEIGINGDSYINTTVHTLWGPKAAGSWPATGVSLIGPQGGQGPQGIQGTQGPQGIQGVQGIPGNTILYGTIDPVAGAGNNGDFFINTTTNFLFGPKTGGAWPAGISLIGPQGIQGIQGIQGLQGPQGNQGIQGLTGTRGSLWYVGSGAPGTITGQLNNDQYLNASTGDTYTLTSGAWSLTGNIRGPAGGTTVYVSDTAPTGVPASSLWWNSANGLLYIFYQDVDSTQWVSAMPLPDLSAYIQKSGDSMTGPLVLPGNPTSALQAAPKQYVDARITRNCISGYPISFPSGTSYMVGQGQCADSTNVDMFSLAANFTKTTAPWAVGSGNGSLDTGASAPPTSWFHIYQIKRPDTGILDFTMSQSQTGPAIGGSSNIPAAYTLFRRVGAVCFVSGAFKVYVQNGDYCQFNIPSPDWSNGNLLTTAQLVSIAVPTNVLLEAVLWVDVSVAANTIAAMTITSPLIPDPGIGSGYLNAGVAVGAAGQAQRSWQQMNILTNASNVRVRGFQTGTVNLTTLGWIDHRGRDQ